MKFFSKFILIGSLLGLSGNVLAVNFFDVLKDHMVNLKNINSPLASEKLSPSCVRRYDKLFNDGKLDIVLGFGYSESDVRDFVYDWPMFYGIKAALVSPCEEGIHACGFVQAKKNPDNYHKYITDHNGKQRIVEITLLRPTLSSSKVKNINAQNRAKQFQYCEAIEKKFYNEIETGAEVVYYSGHSRAGGGPSFCPPKTLSDGHVDYNWYKKNQPGLTKLLHSIQKTNNLQVLALHSCISRGLFYSSIKAVKPQMAFIGTTRSVGMVPDFQNLYGGIDSLLGLRCSPGINSAMKQEYGARLENF